MVRVIFLFINLGARIDQVRGFVVNKKIINFATIPSLPPSGDVFSSQVRQPLPELSRQT